MLLQNKIAIVTGGAKGIGRGITLKFAGEGCSVVIVDIDLKEATNTQSEVSKMGREALAVQCDVTNTAQVNEMVTKALVKFGKIDILVNGAGALPSTGLAETITDEQWDKILALNLKSAFLCCRALIPHMKERKYGKIVSISSLGAIQPPAPAAHYNAAKAGLLGLTQDLAFELAAYNICVNAILPGPIRTAFHDPFLKSVADKEAFFVGLGKKAVPMGRMGTPEDIAGVALFLASDLSAYVSGLNTIVAGGQPLTPYHML